MHTWLFTTASRWTARPAVTAPHLKDTSVSAGIIFLKLIPGPMCKLVIFGRRTSFTSQTEPFFPPRNPQTETLTILCFPRRLWAKEQTSQSNAGKTYFDYIHNKWKTSGTFWISEFNADFRRKTLTQPALGGIWSSFGQLGFIFLHNWE